MGRTRPAARSTFRIPRRISTQPALSHPTTRPSVPRPSVSEARSPSELPLSVAYSVARSFLQGRRTQVTSPLTVDRAELARAEGRALVHDARGARFGDVPCPFGGLGTRLWLRERWTCLVANPRDVAAGRSVGAPILYESDRPAGVHRYQPPATLPRWASRVTLTVRRIRVQRLRQVTDDDARREDVMGWMLDTLERWPHLHESFLDDWRRHTEECDPAARLPSLRGLFAKNWDSRLSPGFLDWSHDPLVWVVEFEVERRRRPGPDESP